MARFSFDLAELVAVSHLNWRGCCDLRAGIATAGTTGRETPGRSGFGPAAGSCLVLSVPPAKGDGHGCVLRVLSYEVALDLTQGPDTFWSRTTVRFRCDSDGAAAVADLHPVSIRQLALNGIRLDPGGVGGGRLELPRAAGENTLVVDAEFGYAPAGEGLHRAISPADGSAFVFSKANRGGAPRIFCCFDQPDLRAPFTVSLRAPAGWSCLGNAGVVARPAGGDAGLWAFAPTTPLAPYLFSVCAGPCPGRELACERDQGPPLPVTVCALTPGAAPFRPEAVLELVRRPLRYYERSLQVPYPYRKCDLVVVPGFPALAFGAPGLIAVRDTALEAGEDRPGGYRALVIAHELAHAWVGGLADMRGEDMWLQEAVTTYLSRAALEETWPGSTPWAAPVSAALPDHGYAGDAAAVRQLEMLIGRQAVMSGLGNLLRRHAHGTAARDDLVRCWSEVSGRDLRSWAAGTLAGSGQRTGWKAGKVELA